MGVLMHFKYMQDFYNKVVDGVSNEQYWNNSSEYKAYYKVLNKNKDLNLWYSKSVKMLSSSQLLKYKTQNTSSLYDEYCKDLKINC